MFGAHEHFFRRRGRLMPKLNITFFITNLMLNIFMLNNFYGATVKKYSGEAQCIITFGFPMCLET